MSQAGVANIGAIPPPPGSVTDLGVDTSTPPGTNPVVPNGSGVITVTGAQVAAGTTTNVIRTDSLAANTVTIQIQRSQAIGVSTIGDNGVSHFNSAQFTVDANGFVSTSGTGVGNTITGNSGGALSPTAGNWNILGINGLSTSGAGSTLSITITNPGVTTPLSGLRMANSTYITGRNAGDSADIQVIEVSAFDEVNISPSTGTNFGGNIKPFSDNTQDNGVQTLRWRDLHIGGNAYIPLTANGIVYGGGTANTNFIAATSGLTDGQLAIGSSAGVPVAATLTAGTGISITNGHNSITITSTGFAFNYTSVNAAASPYTVLSTDYYISVDTSGGAVTLNFPNAPTFKQVWIVKDRTGNAVTNNITLTTPGGTVTFDGATTFVMTSNFQANQLIANSTPTYEIY